MIEVDGVKTYSNKGALEALAKFASHVQPPDSIVEIGVYRGGSLKTIAQAMQPGVRVIGIDTWGLEGAYESGSENPEKYGIENMKIAERLLEGVHNVILDRNFSVEAAKGYAGTVGMLYIDGEHTYEAVHADFKAWSPYLHEGSVVTFDDYTAKPEHLGVRKAIDEIAAAYLDNFKVYGNRLASGFYRGV